MHDIRGLGACDNSNLIEREVVGLDLLVEHVDRIELGIHHLGFHTGEGDKSGTGNGVVEVKLLPREGFALAVEVHIFNGET